MHIAPEDTPIPEQLELPIPWSSPDADPLKDLQDAHDAGHEALANVSPPDYYFPDWLIKRLEENDEKQ